MSKKKPLTPRREPNPAPSGPDETPSHGSHFVVFRETVESIVVAFVLAFLFRTFEAEAFVIPTGSMAPSLQGQHKDVECLQCGCRFRTTASSEGEDREKLLAMLQSERGLGRETLKARIASLDVVGGTCPMCRFLMPMRNDLPPELLKEIDMPEIDYEPSYPGDRILVNKYSFDFTEPERWDVIVFKFPGDGYMNYIKRLVGLPGEEVRVYQGDIFTRPLEGDGEFSIQRKPPDKVAATLNVVHDTRYEASTLYKAGFPLRWAATTPDGWNIEATPGDQTVDLKFSVDATADAPPAWLRYRHQLPDEGDWAIARERAKSGSLAAAAQAEGMSEEEAHELWQSRIIPQLINDFNPYNARLLRGYALQHGWRIEPNFGPNSGNLGTEWVGDLAVECDVDIAEARGEMTLDAVEAGYHFQAVIDLKTGGVKLGIVDGRTGESLDFAASGNTGINSPGEHTLRFANVDDQLQLWVDDELVDCGESTYDPDLLLPGKRAGMLPWASPDQDGDQGDLAPAGVAARGAKLSVSRLAVLRDIYYIATKYPVDSQHLSDYEAISSEFTLDGRTYPRVDAWQELFENPEHWPRFATRRHREFEVQKEQLFVMGDNSPESKDCRLWTQGNDQTGIPGGSYLDRRLLIGKAVYVFWPHSWGSIPGLPILPGWPNFEDMRMVR